MHHPAMNPLPPVAFGWPMSTYEDYSRASPRYDETRVAVGTEIVLGAIAAGPVPLAGAAVLDAACGTGSYAAVLAPRVGSLSMLDADEGMLSVARRKLTPSRGSTAALAACRSSPSRTRPSMR